MGRNMSENRFLELVAKQMNTSVEQLRATYESCYSQDFDDSVHHITKHFMVESDEISDDDYEGSESRGQELCSK